MNMCSRWLVLLLTFSVVSGGGLRKIIMGTTARKCEFPWMVSLSVLQGPEAFSCGGTIIDSTHVLTAAHCFETGVQSLKLHFGGNDIHSMPYEVMVGPSSIHVNKGFQGTTSFQNDIAVVTLPQPLKFTTCLQPLPLAQRGDTFQEPCIIAGWGTTETGLPSSTLRSANVEWYPHTLCQHLIPEVTEQQLCASSTERNEAQSCNGDSGGPLMCRRQSDNEMVMAGVTSFGDIQCNLGVAVYARVSYFLDWIKNTTKLDSTNIPVPAATDNNACHWEQPKQKDIPAHRPPLHNSLIHLINSILNTIHV